MIRKIPVYLLAVILILWWGGGQGWTQAGKIFYVSLQGDDTNPGTTEKPWGTLQHAAEKVQAGDTVYVKAGTYNEEVRLNSSGKSKAPITFAAAPNEQVTVQHFFFKKGVSHVALRDFTVSGFKVWGIEVSGDNHHLLFSGLKIKGGECGVRLTVGTSDQAPEHGPVSHITVENCLIQGPLYAGVDGTPGPCNYLTFRRVEISGAGQSKGDSYAADGISIEKGHHITVEDCNIHDNGGDGIDLNSRDRKGQVEGIMVRRNTVVRNHRNGIKLWSGGRIEGNLVWGQGDTPLTVGPYRGRAELSYNTVAYNMWAKEFGGRNYAAALGYPEEGIAKPRVDVVMHHNIFAFNSGPAYGEPAGLYMGPGLRLVEEHHNLYYSFPESEIVALFLNGEREFSRKDIQHGEWAKAIWAKATGRGKGDLSVNPRFVSGWPEVDLHLKSGSPAADWGVYAYPSTKGSTAATLTAEKPATETRALTSGSPEAISSEASRTMATVESSGSTAATLTAEKPAIETRALTSGSPEAISSEASRTMATVESSGSTAATSTAEKPATETRALISSSPEAISSEASRTMATVESSVPGPVSFRDNFEDGWDSRWYFTENISVVSDTHRKGHVLSFKESSIAEIVGLEVEDTTLEFRVKPEKAELIAPVMSVTLRVHGKHPQQSYYRVVFFPERMTIRRKLGKQKRTLAQVHKGLKPGVWQKVSIKLQGGQIEVSWDGKPVLAAKDTKNLSPGVVAFFSHGGSPGFAIDDVNLTSPGATARVPQTNPRICPTLF